MQGDLIIKNACVITGSGPVFPSGFIHISNGEITAIGDEKDLRNTQDPSTVLRPEFIEGLRAGAIRTTTIDAKGRYVLPGFINPHMHLYSALARGMAVGRMRTFGEVLKKLWWRLDSKLSLEDVRVSALLGGIEAIKSGVTTLIDHHASYGAVRGSLSTIGDAMAMLGLRASLCFEISDRNGKGGRNEAIDESGAWLEDVSLKIESESGYLLRGMVGLHASMTLLDETLDHARELMEVFNVGAHVHVAEGGEDRKITRRKCGLSPVARFVRKGLLRPGSLAVHCVHVDRGDIALLKKCRTYVVHNPISNLNNAVGVAPILEMARQKIPVAIGTDGMSAGVSKDIGLAAVLHKIFKRDAQAGECEIRDAVWKSAPRIVSHQFGADIGSLRKGAAADIIIIDAVPPTEVTAQNAWWHVLFGVLNATVRTTIVAGCVRMLDFKLVGIDEDEIAREARGFAKKLWRRI